MTVPTLTGFSLNIAFNEALVNAAPQLLDTDVVLTAGTSGFGNSTLTITGLLAEDVISVRNQGAGFGQIGVSGSTLTLSGIAVGTISGGNGSEFTINFGIFASEFLVDLVIQNLTYQNLSNSPTPSRSLVLDITDASGAHLNARVATFRPLEFYTDPPEPIEYRYTYQAAPTAVDLDNDGDLDLVIGERFGSMTYFRNNGNSSFTDVFGGENPFQGWDFGTDSTPSFGDIDNDGDLDLVVGVTYGTVQTYTNNGSNAFTQLIGAANPFNGIESGSKPALVDLDNDGDTDVVFGRNDGTLRFFSNNGAGAFTELTGAGNPLNGIDVGEESAPTFVDLDGDGSLDLVVGAYSGSVHSFLNNGAGAFTQLIGAANPFDGADVGYIAAPTFLDVNGDGVIDMVVGAYDGSLQTFLGIPDAPIRVTVTADSNVPQVSGLRTSVTFGENLVNVTPQLLDADVVFTDDDGVFVNGSFVGGRLTVSGLLAEDRVSILNQGAGAGQIGLSGANVTFGGIVIGTLAGGLGTPLVISFTAAAAQASIDALIQALTYANVSNTPTASRTFVLDVTDAQGQHLNAAPTTFGPLTGIANPFGFLDVGGNADATFGDLDNDGDIDMVVGRYLGGLQTFVNNGAGQFSELTGAANPFDAVTAGVPAPYFSSPSLGDLDSDGDMDLVFGVVGGGVRTFVNNGSGGFSELIGGANPFNAVDVGVDSTPELVDFDGDGDIDLVVGSKYGGQLFSYVNNGAGSFSLLTGASDPFSGKTFGNNINPGFVDLDKDGDMDAVVGLGDGTFRYLSNNGAGRFFEPPPSFNPFVGLDFGNESAVSFYDVDGDGDLDAVVGNSSGILRMYENTSPLTPPGVTIAVSVTKEVDTFTGNGSNNNLVGTADADVLTGLGGNDILNGGLGNDTMLGGAGDDTYVVDTAFDRVFETTTTASILDAGGTDTVKSAVNFNLDANAGVRFVEHLTLTGTTDTKATGNALANTLTGNRGNNVLNGGLGNDSLQGGLGNDTMLGGAGNDTYQVNTAGDQVFETTTTASIIDAGGTDTVQSAESFNLDASAGVRFVEHLTLTGTANTTATGNALGNLLTGNGGNNVLNGGLGNDTMLGGAGNDIYVVNAAADRVFETTTTASVLDAGGTDTVQSAVNFNLDANAGVRFVEHLTLTGAGNISASGNALGNLITGNAGNNVLNGGLGRDTMLGGAGNDTFVFNAATGTTNIDRIDDFNVIEDTIRLDDAVFAGLANGTLSVSAFASNANGVATDALDRVIYATDTGRLYFDADGDGAGARVHFATLTAIPVLTNADVFVF